MAAITPMMTMAMISSIRVKPFELRIIYLPAIKSFYDFMRLPQASLRDLVNLSPLGCGLILGLDLGDGNSTGRRHARQYPDLGLAPRNESGADYP